MKIKLEYTGLTLVEIMVAVTIVALLVAGLYSVSNYVETQSKIRLTKSTIEVLCTALEQYHDFYGKFPDINDVNGVPVPDLTRYNKADSIEKLYYKLSLAPDAKKVLNNIGPSLIKDADKDKYAEIVDAWGGKYHYDYDRKQKDNFPVITSDGPDKIPNTDDDISSK
jgi:prepilin-type N-terminal cleavage/methylation domain-containing protein